MLKFRFGDRGNRLKEIRENLNLYKSIFIDLFPMLSLSLGLCVCRY